MKKEFLCVIMCLSVTTSIFSQFKTWGRNLVPNKETAIKIAEAIWLPLYGKGIYRDTPFVAELVSNSKWVVNGTLPPPKEMPNGDLMIVFGGTPHIEIRKKNGRILKVGHGK